MSIFKFVQLEFEIEMFMAIYLSSMNLSIKKNMIKTTILMAILVAFLIKERESQLSKDKLDIH